MEELDQKIFVLLLEDPFRSINDITKKLEVSFKKVNDTINLMKERGIILNDYKFNDPVFGERIRTHISANINSNNLGLVRDHVLFYDITDKETLSYVEIFCDIHPYTTYRSQLINNSYGLYVQFEFPPHIFEDMVHLYKYLCDKLQVKFNRMIGSEAFYLKPSFFYENYLTYQNIINKNEKDKTRMIDFFWNKYIEEKENGKLRIINQIDSLTPKNVSYLSEIHLKLLRELTINGIVSITDLSKYYDRDKSTISRHVAAIKEKYIRSGILIFKPDLNQSFNSFKIISGTFSFENGMTKTEFQEFISSQEFPFYGYFIFDNNNNFIMYVATNYFHFPEIFDFLKTVSDKIYVYDMNITTSLRYYFYHLNFDEKGIFNTDKKYFYDDPLEKLEKLMNSSDVIGVS